MPVFSIEGNIGSGKSTLLEQLKKISHDIVYVPEPVDEWNNFRDSSGETILSKYYKDQVKWSFPFQMMAFITRAKQFREIVNKNKVIVMERSVFTDREIFAKMLYDSKKMHEIEHAIYLKWFDELIGDLKIDGIVYVRTTPEVCQQRVESRSRAGESNISFEYLSECDQYHEEWLKEYPEKLVLNGDVKTPEEMAVESLTFFLLQSLKYSFSRA